MDMIFTAEEHICCTSVEDGLCSLRSENRIDVLKKALTYEQSHKERRTMINALMNKIHRLEKKKYEK